MRRNKFKAWIILNKYGDLWSNDIFETKAKAQKYVKEFWDSCPIQIKGFAYKQAHITMEYK